MRATIGLAIFSAALLWHGASYAEDDGLARAKAAVDAHRAKPQFTAPGPAFDIKAYAGGKKMLSIPNNSTNPFLKGIIDRESRAKADTGLDVHADLVGPAMELRSVHPRQRRAIDFARAAGVEDTGDSAHDRGLV